MKPLARQNQIIVEELVGECIVYDSNLKKAHNLNATLTWIWRHSDGSTSVEDMARDFEWEFGGSNSQDVILSGIQQLEANNLLMPSTTGEVMMSRRAVVAAGSALAPIIASVLVPTAASAKSVKDKDPKDKGK